MNFTIVAIYKFTSLDNYISLRQPLLKLMVENEVKGTFILANEGINGTICGPEYGIEIVLQWLQNDPRLADLEYKKSQSDKQAFYRSKVKIKKEIVTMGKTDIDPLLSAGTYVEPKDWNALISDPEVTVIDTRNDYEVQTGKFKNAINPNTKNFREFPAYADTHLDKKQHKKVAMYCTGGIRCEKSTAWLKEQGFNEVYHLKGGILKYLEEIPKEKSLWQGECFVFDQRVTVNHKLEPGNYDQCYACRTPITEKEKDSIHYQKGISCPHCYNKNSAKQTARFTEREKQIELAKSQGKVHIGDKAAVTK